MSRFTLVSHSAWCYTTDWLFESLDHAGLSMVWGSNWVHGGAERLWVLLLPPWWAGLCRFFLLIADSQKRVDSPLKPAVFQQICIWSLIFSKNDQKCSKQDEKLKIFFSCFVERTCTQPQGLSIMVSPSSVPGYYRKMSGDLLSLRLKSL